MILRRLFSLLWCASFAFVPMAVAQVAGNKVAGNQVAGNKITEAPKPLTSAELADGWIALFDGQTLFGWKAASKANWEVNDGAIIVTGGEKGLLCTTVEFDNYVLKADF
ncbi:MAG: DUF1080 domain-containing protein, partial [Planctomycetia bacterium]|nr:DUF1080 domain-containing protein [Planctomycetia bacterium]